MLAGEALAFTPDGDAFAEFGAASCDATGNRVECCVELPNVLVEAIPTGGVSGCWAAVPG